MLQKISKAETSWTTVTNQNCIHKEIKGRLNAGNAYYHSIQNPLSSQILYVKT
jgi:hypothetical protein